MIKYKDHKECRVCGNKSLIEYLDLGKMPLSNSLLRSPIEVDCRYPLKVMLCEVCNLSQLSIVIPPEEMFANYVYRSSISKGYKEHCHKMSLDLKDKYNLNSETCHIDIAGNDGALLAEFHKVLNHYCLNVDPAENLKSICESQDIDTISKFWDSETTEEIVNTFGQADLITATNVFAHVDDVKDFMLNVKKALKPSGILVLEFPYLIDFIDHKEFDTIYFEHLSYFSIYPLTILCAQIGLKIKHVEKQSIHGGSVRVIIGHGQTFDETVFDFLIKERAYRSLEVYRKFAEDVQTTIDNFQRWLKAIHKEERNIAAFAASAKGNILLNAANIKYPAIRAIYDETPEKIGKYSPGTNGIVILDLESLPRMHPEYLVILSWNFADEIVTKCRQAGYKGKFVIPIPEIKIYN